MAMELSGKGWCSRFPSSKSIGDCTEPFRSNLQRFNDALVAAGANVKIADTLRPEPRAFLMFHCCKVATGAEAPGTVPARPDIEIDWVHRNDDGTPNLAKSRAAAHDMMQGYDIAHAPALNSRHIFGEAVDMSVTWLGDLTIQRGDGSNVTISTLPRSGDDNINLHAVGATYGVIKLSSDPPHWSLHGN